ncbi:N-acetylmuramoyl-L-alanine amidase family protein [Spirochaeta cellobiosiphila]|uniref:N-acetylmuramoyl-L-alanine amidase family protein n=1 Tax=Spirochaeta cellobiosiphila TaxID=504483 RepID=UPI0004066F88|nr:N-acetylmuramoyl-L-alanine amidase [Spirochaeta cellobiosiphila]
MGKLIIPFFLFLLYVGNVFGADVDLEYFSQQNGLELLIQPLSYMFTLSDSHKQLNGQWNNPFLLMGQTLWEGSNVRIQDGRIIIDDRTQSKIREYFQLGEITTNDHSNNTLSPEIAVIIIDPGHGGKDSGAMRTYEIEHKKVVMKEKDIVLQVSLDLFNRLKKKYPDKKILLTRNKDVYPTLEDRVELANKQNLASNQAIIYISVHVNASLNPKSTGFEVWHLPTDYRREVLDPSSLEEKVKDYYPIFNSMMEDQFFIEGIILAQNILENMESQLGQASNNRGLKEESWYVVRKANMPSVLVEIGFISNKEEALKLHQDSYLNKICTGLYNGIVNFTEYFERSKAFTE